MYKRGFYMGKRIMSILISVGIMYLFSIVFLAGLTALVFYRNLDREVAEGGIMLTYILTGFVGGIIISLFHNRTLEIKWPAYVALGYCLCFFAISLICGGKTVSENLTTYLMILFLISSTAVVGYILAYTKRRKR